MLSYMIGFEKRRTNFGGLWNLWHGLKQALGKKAKNQIFFPIRSSPWIINSPQGEAVLREHTCCLAYIASVMHLQFYCLAMSHTNELETTCFVEENKAWFLAWIKKFQHTWWRLFTCIWCIKLLCLTFMSHIASWCGASLEEKMKHDFLHQKINFFDTTGHTSPLCNVAHWWPQLLLFCKISFD